MSSSAILSFLSTSKPSQATRAVKCKKLGWFPSLQIKRQHFADFISSTLELHLKNAVLGFHQLSAEGEVKVANDSTTGNFSSVSEKQVKSKTQKYKKHERLCGRLEKVIHLMILKRANNRQGRDLGSK